ncbi:MAG: ATP-binding protein [Candidatus Coatesbacteria bacterium]
MNRLPALQRLLAAVAIVIPIVVLAGWFFRIPLLKTFVPDAVSMKVNIAVGLLAAGSALRLFRLLARRRRARVVYAVCVAFVFVASVATMSQDIGGWNLGMDQLLINEPAGEAGTNIPGRPAMGGMLCLLLASVSLGLLPFARLVVAAQWFALASFMVAFRSFTGYMLGAYDFYSFGKFTDMALPGTIAFQCLAGAILLSRPSRGFVAVFASAGPGGVLLRWLSPSMICVLFLLGWIADAGQDRGLYNSAYGISLMVMVGSVVIVAAIRIGALWLNRVDLERTESMLQLRNAMERLTGVQNKMVEQARLRAMGEMASGIAHDFNNALAPILGFTETLLEWPETLKNRRETLDYLRTIRQSAQDAAQMVGRLRTFYSSSGGEKPVEPCDVNRLVQDSIVLTRPMWRSRAGAEGRAVGVVAEPGTVRPVLCNPDEIREMLLNLIMNAVDALPHGGTVTIRTREEKTECVIEVRDDGVGMTEEVRRRCFEPFFTTKGKGGSGLGLPMVAAILHRRGGSVRVESAPGRGTAFFVRLPLGSVAGRIAKPAVAGPWKAPLRILVADDEPRIVRLLSGLLKRDGHRVTSAADGVAALDAFRARRFDLVITDRVMPGMSGDELADAVKRLRPTCPVIMVSGIASPAGVVDTGRAPADYSLPKPFSLAALREAINRVMAAAQG